MQEQIAGDELADYEHAPKVTAEMFDNLVATGFLRMAPDATWANITGYVPDRIEVMADEIDVLGSAVLGLTLKCARCHSHKFDPIPQRDYYRLVDVFKGAYDEYDWLKPDVRPGLGPVSQDILPGRLLPRDVGRGATQTRREQLPDPNGSRGDPVGRFDRKADAIAAELLDERLARLPEVLRDDLRAMLATAADKRDAVQRLYLASKFEAQLRIDHAAVEAADPAFKAESEEADRRVKSLEAGLRQVSRCR